METTIHKRISPNKMMKVFDKINIRHYTPVVNSEIEISDFDKVINYEIRIRHNEDEDPKKLLKEAIESLELKRPVGRFKLTNFN